MNKYSVSIITFLLTLPTFAQGISGKYERKDNSPIIEEGTVINFEKNFFKEITTGHLGISSVRKGNFKVKGDTLILNFQESPEEAVVISKKTKINQNNISQEFLTNLFININFREGKKRQDVIIQFKEKNKKFIAMPVRAKNTFSLYNNKIKSFTVSSLGMNDVLVDLKPLLGFSTIIEIYLSDTKFESANPKSQKFVIEKLENGGLKLASLNKKDIWQLEKIK
ncbi:hypothetical protein [Salegentibacter mishustinae]|uniref:hypothetical protein n=1 Tax=Salegentibacter mishustinae TaxID=270918 RepID=UPI00248F9A96|nr:hypothetical protein [Salegentibacter mishustinae]